MTKESLGRHGGSFVKSPLESTPKLGHHILRSALFAFAACMVLTSCSKGLDRTADFSNQVNYRTMVDRAFSEMTPAEAAAFDWAVSDQTLDSLTTKYSGKSFRQIAFAEIDGATKQYSAELSELERSRSQFDAMVSDLKKVTATVPSTAIEKGSFGGPSFVFPMMVKNGSGLEFSTLTWTAKLYIDGGKEPVATARMLDMYEREGGLKAGQEVTRRGTPDTFFSKEWITLAVQNAKDRRVDLSLTDAQNFGNKSVLVNSPYPRIAKLNSDLAEAKTHRAAIVSN